MFEFFFTLSARREYSFRPLLAVALAVFAIGAVAVSARASATDPLFAAPFLSYDAGSLPYCVALGDLNGDGILDMAVVNNASNSVSVLLGNGNGTFGAKADYATGTNPRSVAIGSLNSATDAIPDLVVANYADTTVSVLLGNGNGTFKPKADYSSLGIDPTAVEIGDLDRDGIPDLTVVNGYGVMVLRGAGDGTFVPWWGVGGGHQRFCGAMGDLDADGKLDLVTGIYGGGVYVMLGIGNGCFGPSIEYSHLRTLQDSYSVAVGDLNHDLIPDLVVANTGYGSHPGHTVSVLLGLGDGTFGTPADYAIGTAAFPSSVAIGDFNHDSNPDLVVANYGDSPQVSILLGIGDGTFAWKTDYATGPNPKSVAVGDLNGDGRLDLAVANAGTGSTTVSVLLGNGNGTFGAKTNLVTGTTPRGATIRDLNGDGKADIVVANEGSNSASVFLGNGNGTFGTKTDFPTGTNPRSLAIGSLNSATDAIPDLVAANYGGGSGSTVSVLLGTGTGSFGTRTNFGTGSGPVCVAVGSLNGNADAIADLAVANYNSNTVSVLLGNGLGAFGTKADYATGSNPSAVAIGSLNSNTDAIADLAVANLTSNTVSVLLGAGDGTFGPGVEFPTGVYPRSVAIGDLNADGKPDLAVANYNSNTVSVLLGNGLGAFGTRTDYPTGAAPYSVTIADVNGDGKPDLASADVSSNTVSVLLGNGSGTFGAKTDFGAGNGPNSVAVGDLNGDGKPELAVANQTSGTVSVLYNTGGHPWIGVPVSPAVAGPLRVNAWPNPLVADAAISFNLPGRAEVSVRVYDIAGRLVSVLARGTMTSGAHEARWNLASDSGQRVRAGIYLVELRAGAQRATTRVVVLR